MHAIWRAGRNCVMKYIENDTIRNLSTSREGLRGIIDNYRWLNIPSLQCNDYFIK